MAVGEAGPLGSVSASRSSVGRVESSRPDSVAASGLEDSTRPTEPERHSVTPAFARMSLSFCRFSADSGADRRAVRPGRSAEQGHRLLHRAVAGPQRQRQPHRGEPVLVAAGRLHVALHERLVDADAQLRGDVARRGDGALRPEQERRQDERVAAVEDGELVRLRELDEFDGVLQVAGRVLDADDVGYLGEPGDGVRLDADAAAGGRVVVQHDRLRRALRDPAEVVDQLRLIRLDEVRGDDGDAVGAFLLGHPGEPDDLAGGLGPGADEHRRPPAAVLDGGGDDLLLLALVEGVELAGGAEDEDAVHALGEHEVDVLPQAAGRSSDSSA